MALCKAMGAGKEQEDLLLPLVQTAQQALAARLRAGVEPEDCPAFALAAALVAMEGLEGARGLSSVASFTAGEVTIRREGTESGTSRTDQALRLLAPWLGLVKLDLGGTLVLVVLLALSAPTLAGLVFMGERLHGMVNDWKNKKARKHV